MFDDDCIDGTAADVPTFLKTLSSNPLLGGIIVLEHTSKGPGYYYQRGVFQRGWKNPQIPTTWMLWGDAETWINYLTTNKLNSVVVAYTVDPNPWQVVFKSWWPELLVDLFGLSSLAVFIYGLQALIRYKLYYSDAAMGNKKKAGGQKFNLMFNIVCVEVFCNIWRMLFAFGEGNQILNRGIAVWDVQVSFSLPQILVFGNAISTLNAWIAMTRMTQTSPEELTKKLAGFHFWFIFSLVIFELAKATIFVMSPAALQIPLTNGSLLFYVCVMIFTCGLFFRGYYIFRSKMVTGAKSSSSKPSAVELFMIRVNSLATSLGISFLYYLFNF